MTDNGDAPPSNIVPIHPWLDFNDAPSADIFDIQPDADQIGRFFALVFDRLTGRIPLRLFDDHATGARPYTSWIKADGEAVGKAVRAAERANERLSAFYVIPGTVNEPGQGRAEDITQMQTVVVDLDLGDTAARLAHLRQHLGEPAMVVASGGRTTEGCEKLHVWWRLSVVAHGANVKRVSMLRRAIADKVGGDIHFGSPHQPIRVAGSIYHKGAAPRLVEIREEHASSIELDELALRIQRMPPLPLDADRAVPSAITPAKPPIAEILTTPVREGGQDAWTRYDGASSAIGYWVRRAHEGSITWDQAWGEICGYNAACLRPPWELERLRREFDSLWTLHVSKYGPAVERVETEPDAVLPTVSLGELIEDTSPMPEDLISPRLLTPGGLLVVGGAPKVGKSDFVISLLAHMAAGVPFLGFAPPRPLSVFYLQAEVQYHYLRERIQAIRLAPEVLAAARDRLVATPKVRMLLDANGVAAVIAAVRGRFGDIPPDIVVVDPIRNLFDGGEDGGGENDNSAMLFFLQERVEALRAALSDDTGIILCHHTRKMDKKQQAADPFQSLSGASSLRGFYTSGVLMHRPDEDQPERMLHFELRNGPAIDSKLVCKQAGAWVELDKRQSRIVRQDYGAKLDAERTRKRDVILDMLIDEAARGHIYTSNRFANRFENENGLGGNSTIRDRISVLVDQGLIRFFSDGEPYGLPAAERTRLGYMCVEGMTIEGKAVIATHYKDPDGGAILPIKTPLRWPV